MIVKQADAKKKFISLTFIQRHCSDFNSRMNIYIMQKPFLNAFDYVTYTFCTFLRNIYPAAIILVSTHQLYVVMALFSVYRLAWYVIAQWGVTQKNIRL